MACYETLRTELLVLKPQEWVGRECAGNFLFSFPNSYGGSLYCREVSGELESYPVPQATFIFTGMDKVSLPQSYYDYQGLLPGSKAARSWC